MMFHWKYADERIDRRRDRSAGWSSQDRQSRPRRAGRATPSITKFANSPYETKTDTEQAFSA